MAECSQCGEEFPDRRHDLGYRTCLKCGETTAQTQIRAKRAMLMPQGNKQGLTLLSQDRDTAKNQIRQLTGKGKHD